VYRDISPDRTRGVPIDKLDLIEASDAADNLNSELEKIKEVSMILYYNIKYNE